MPKIFELLESHSEQLKALGWDESNKGKLSKQSKKRGKKNRVAVHPNRKLKEGPSTKDKSKKKKGQSNKSRSKKTKSKKRRKKGNGITTGYRTGDFWSHAQQFGVRGKGRPNPFRQ